MGGVVSNTPVEIDFLDKPRALFLDGPAAVRIEENVKINVLTDIGGFLVALAVPSTLFKLTRELLLHEDPKATSEGIAKSVTSGAQFNQLMESAIRCWFHFQGKSDEDCDKFLADMKNFGKKKAECPHCGKDPSVAPDEVEQPAPLAMTTQ